ncbi:MAG: polyketide cyclase [Lysobacteraceae bacterium]
MIRLLELLIALVVVAVLFVVFGAVLPQHRSVQQVTETNRALPVVFDLMNGFKRFKDWNELRKLDPKVKLTISGPDSGVGAHLDFSSTNPAVGSGSWQITNVVPNERIDFEIKDDAYGTNKKMSLRFKKIGQNKKTVEITEAYSVDYGWNLFGRYAGMYIRRSAGDRMKSSLSSLSALLATVPKFDYTRLPNPISIVEVPAENLLYAPTEAKRANDEVQSAMVTQMKWLKQVIDKNNLVATGPVRVIDTNFGAESYEFDLAIPVRKRGGSGTDTTDSAKTDEAATNTDAEPAIDTAAPVGGPLQTLEVKLDGPVKYRQTQALRTVTVNFTGHPAALPAVRDSMKAWAVTHGEDVTDRPWEVYNKGIAGSFVEDGEFAIFWPLKPVAQ